MITVYLKQELKRLARKKGKYFIIKKFAKIINSMNFRINIKDRH